MTGRLPTRAVVVATILAGGSGASALLAQVPAPSASLPVCYALRLVASPETDPARWGPMHHPPDTVALDTSLVRGGNLIRPATTYHKRGGIWRAAGDSLFMSWRNPLTGVILRGMVQDSAYHGIAVLLTDVVTPRPIPPAWVAGRQVACPVRLLRP